MLVWCHHGNLWQEAWSQQSDSCATTSDSGAVLKSFISMSLLAPSVRSMSNSCIWLSVKVDQCSFHDTDSLAPSLEHQSPGTFSVFQYVIPGLSAAAVPPVPALLASMANTTHALTVEAGSSFDVSPAAPPSKSEHKELETPKKSCNRSQVKSWRIR